MATLEYKPIEGLPVTVTAHETSLSKLSEHDWQVLSNRWARGVDWYVRKVGKRHWTPIEALGRFPLFTTKKAAELAATNLILAESHWRAAKRLRGEVTP